MTTTVQALASIRAQVAQVVENATRDPNPVRVIWSPGIVPAMRAAALDEGGSVQSWEVRAFTEWTFRGAGDRWCVVVRCDP